MDESETKGLERRAVRGLNVKGCEGKNCGVLAERWGRKLLSLQDPDDSIDNRRDGLVVEMAGAIKNQVDTGRKEPVWPDVARFAECSLCKLHVGDADGVAIPDLLARDLAEDEIVPTRCRDNKSRAPLHRREIREGKRYNDNIALYKSLHASSSSGRSQSFRSAGSLARAVSGAAFRRRDLRYRMKSSTSPYVRGGRSFNSLMISSFTRVMATSPLQYMILWCFNLHISV